jgi:hypothetical protein
MALGEIRGFAIQREDAAWFAGRADDGSVCWPTERDQRHVFVSGSEAMAVLTTLQDSGCEAQLFALLEP